MFQQIPTWQVKFLKLGMQEQFLRVPETNLEAVINVLVFNNMEEIHAEIERLPWSLATDLGNEPDAGQTKAGPQGEAVGVDG